VPGTTVQARASGGHITRSFGPPDRFSTYHSLKQAILVNRIRKQAARDTHRNLWIMRSQRLGGGKGGISGLRLGGRKGSKP
jgi:hypothetical protein